MKKFGIAFGVLAVIVLGFVLIKPPTPPISLAAEPIWDLGGYTITNTILSAWVVIVLLGGLAFFLYRRLRNVEEALVPRGFQNVIEGLLEAFYGVVELVAGPVNGRRFFPAVASIFLILLFANWFGLMPWNNVFGRTVDLRFEHLEVLEEDAEGVLADLGSGRLGADELNAAFGVFYFDPIPFEVDHFDEADGQIAGIVTGTLSAREQAVRAEFLDHPIARDTTGHALVEAVEERVDAAIEEHPFSPADLEAIGADGAPAAVEKAIVFNLPLTIADIDDAELKGAVIKSGGVDLIPPRATDFEYDPYLETLVVRLGNDGAITGARLFNTTEPAGEKNPALAVDEFPTPVTVNLTHVGLLLKMEEEEIGPNEGVGEIFPYFRSIATDLNLPLAMALWAFIFVQFWGVQSLGAFSNFGKFIGVGKATVVKGPIGVAVGILEIISELSRIISFTFRLFGNIFAGEIVLFMAAFLVPFLAATVFYGLEVFVGFIQAFVFAMLTLVFAVTAVSHAGHEHEEEEPSGGGREPGA